MIIKLDNPAQEEKEPVVNESESFDQKFKKELQKLDEVKNSTLHNIVEDAHQDAMAVVNKLERLREVSALYNDFGNKSPIHGFTL